MGVSNNQLINTIMAQPGKTGRNDPPYLIACGSTNVFRTVQTLRYSFREASGVVTNCYVMGANNLLLRGLFLEAGDFIRYGGPPFFFNHVTIRLKVQRLRMEPEAMASTVVPMGMGYIYHTVSETRSVERSV